MAALGFLSGLQSGMQSTMGLLDALEQRQRREQEAKQQQVIFDNKLEEYNYDKSVLRPLRENEVRYRLSDLKDSVDFNEKYRPMQLEDTRLSLDDKRALVAHNKQYRPLQLSEANLRLDILRNDKKWAEDDRGYTLEVLRPQEKRVNDLNYDIAKTNFDTTKADNARKLAEQNLTRANQLYTAASSLVDSNPSEAERLMGEADKLSGGLFTNAANGVNSRMFQQAQEVMAGQRDLYDKDFLETSRQYTKPTLINTGRADKYEFGGIESLPDGRVGYKLLPKFGGQYLESIKQAGERFGVDPRLVGAVIGAESAGNKSAVSPKGAQGLMQLMPETGREVAKRIGLDNFNPDNPEHNILVGTAYLGEQLKKYKGDVSLALAAYNAGPGAVDKHKGIPPFAETQAYVPKILKDYQRLVNGVPATKNRSSDLNDTIMADTPEQALGKIQRGVELEQGMNPRLKEMLQVRQVATGSKPVASITGKDRYMEVNDRVFDVVSQQFVTDKTTDGEKLVKVGKDERLYDPAAGKWVSPSGASAGNGSLVDLLGEDSALAPVAAIVDKQNPELSLPKKLEKAKTLAGTDFDLESDPASKALDANFKANRLQGAEAWLNDNLGDYVQSGDISADDIKVFAQKIAKQDLGNDAAEHLVVSELKSRLVAQRDKLQLQKQYSDEGRILARAEGYEERADIVAGYQKRDAELARLNQRIAELDAVLNPKQQ